MAAINKRYPSQCSYRGELFMRTKCFGSKREYVEEYYRCKLPKGEKCPRMKEIEFEIFDVKKICPDKKKI
jgi:hypothetical protein